MAGILGRWVLSSVIRSGLAFEAEAIGAYREIRAALLSSGHCDESFESSVCHLLEEEEAHRRILADVASGKMSLGELERLVQGHLYGKLDDIRPLSGADRERWEPALSAALEQEEKTWIFYGNLRRMSKIPLVRRAFEVLAGMEKEHGDILRNLLGRAGTAAPSGQ